MHSVSPYVDYELTREMTQHGFCDPDMATKAGELISKFNKVKGRMFPEEDWSVLQRLTELAEQTEGRVRLYDVSRIADRLKAVSRGVTKTPVIIVDGEKSEGAEKCLNALERACANLNR